MQHPSSLSSLALSLVSSDCLGLHVTLILEHPKSTTANCLRSFPPNIQSTILKWTVISFCVITTCNMPFLSNNMPFLSNNMHLAIQLHSMCRIWKLAKFSNPSLMLKVINELSNAKYIYNRIQLTFGWANNFFPHKLLNPHNFIRYYSYTYFLIDFKFYYYISFRIFACHIFFFLFLMNCHAIFSSYGRIE